MRDENRGHVGIGGNENTPVVAGTSLARFQHSGETSADGL